MAYPLLIDSFIPSFFIDADVNNMAVGLMARVQFLAGAETFLSIMTFRLSL
jgi:hypothetical protein